MFVTAGRTHAAGVPGPIANVMFCNLRAFLCGINWNVDSHGCNIEGGYNASKNKCIIDDNIYYV